MKAAEARAEWARMLRLVADGQMTPGEALAKQPHVDEGEDSVPRAYWSAGHKLKAEIELDLTEDLDKEWRAPVFRRLADRIEGVSRIP
jgi:hypothetical protein